LGNAKSASVLGGETDESCVDDNVEDVEVTVDDANHKCRLEHSILSRSKTSVDEELDGFYIVDKVTERPNYSTRQTFSWKTILSVLVPHWKWNTTPKHSEEGRNI
jgi:hypothetical protein